MALTTFLMTVTVVAVASAGFPGWPFGVNTFTGLNPPMMSLRFASQPPLAGMPNFPALPFFQFPAIPTMPPMQFQPMPSPQDIVNMKPPAGGTYSGIAISTNTKSGKKKDGSVGTSGGTTLVVNDNGNVKVETIGDNPPPVGVNTASSFGFDVPQIKPVKPFQFEPIKPFNHFHFKHFPTFEPVNPEKIRGYVPKDQENYVGHSVSSSSYIIKNGDDVKEGASVSRLDNDNGVITEDQLVYHKDSPTE